MLTKKSTYKLVLLAIIATLVFSTMSLPGCIYVNAETSDPKYSDDNHKRSAWRAKLEQRQYNVDQFTGVDAGGIFDVTIQPGDAFSVLISAKPETHAYIDADVRGDVLTLDFSKSMRRPGDVIVAIVMPTLNQVEVSGAAEMQVFRGFNADKFTLVGSGASNIDIDIDANSISADLSGASDVRMAGNANHLKLDGSGATEFSGKNLLVGNAQVDLSGASDAAVNVSNDLDVDLSGSSDLRCGRSPQRIHVETSGVADVDC